MVNKFLKSHELLRRLIVMIFVLIMFIIGRNIILYGIDVSKLLEERENIQNLLVSVVSGDLNRYSILALGIMPNMTASILIQFVTVVLPSNVRKRISQHKLDVITVILTFLFACFLAYSRTNELEYLDLGISIFELKVISMIEMVIGAMAILLLTKINKDYGIGSQTPIILINIIEGLYTSISNNLGNIPILLVIICAAIFAITILIENIELRIPVQRVSIHNIYADKNYIAFKINLIGIMPIMFSTSIFILVKYILYAIGGYFPDNYMLLHINANMDLTSRIGVNTYLMIVFILTILFAFIMLQPSEMADNLQKGGDSIVGVYAGKSTKRYFSFTILVLGIVSGVILSASMALSLLLAVENVIPSDLSMLPSSIMILVSVVSNMLDEAIGYYKFDSYKFFI